MKLTLISSPSKIFLLALTFQKYIVNHIQIIIVNTNLNLI